MVLDGEGLGIIEDVGGVGAMSDCVKLWSRHYQQMVLYDQGLQKFYNSPDIQNIIKTNRPLVFDKTKDMELTNNLTSVISDGEVFT